MRPALAVALLVVLAGLPLVATAGSAGPGAAPAVDTSAATDPLHGVNARSAADTPSDDAVTVTGKVTYRNGTAATDASVLAGSCPFFEKSPPSRLREVAAGDGGDVRVVDVDAEGRYSIAVEPGNCIVALSPTGVSRVARVEDSGVHSLTLYPSKPLQFETTTGVAEPGGRTIVHVDLKNTGDEPVEGLRLKVGALPEGWNLVAVKSETGTFHRGNRTFVWERLPAGEWAEADIRLFVAIDAETGTHELPLFADSDNAPVTAANMTVEVRYPTTAPTETHTAQPATGDDGIGDTGVGAPGLGPGIAVVALLLSGLLAARTR